MEIDGKGIVVDAGEVEVADDEGGTFGEGVVVKSRMGGDEGGRFGIDEVSELGMGEMTEPKRFKRC